MSPTPRNPHNPLDRVSERIQEPNKDLAAWVYLIMLAVSIIFTAVGVIALANGFFGTL